MTKPKATKSPLKTTAGRKTARSTAASSPRPEKKTDILIAMLKRDGGAALAEITGATGWLPHSARAMLTGLRKKGYELDKTKVEGVTRYCITGEPAA